ncbi:hypothetical protein LOC67_27030 [Stieleria sp. JC731]|uniref:hypothetical protein n=1 Tax=Stieleria sp. JC731 TaxID=2894195 RepID=UPI001E2C494F|nr:hypothetical protein [Stieleria sp. JC731]MCC9604224.1 hypothetical protein [Stieleria sp. JC731]
MTASQVTIYATIRKWAALFASLIATIPIGLAIDLILVELNLIHFNDRTAIYWAVSSITASLICSSVTAWLTTPRLNWYQFWLTYQFGWLIYFFSGGIGQSHNQTTSILYLSIPFIVPAIVAMVAPLFNTRPKAGVDLGSE